MTTPRHSSVWDRVASINKPSDWNSWVITNYAIDPDNAPGVPSDKIKWEFNFNSLEAAMYARLIGLPTWNQTEIMAAFSLADTEWTQFAEIFTSLSAGNAAAQHRSWRDWSALNYLAHQGHLTDKSFYYNRYGVTTADDP